MIVSRDHIFKDGELKDKVILVSGAAGSIGSEICRQISKHSYYTLFPW